MRCLGDTLLIHHWDSDGICSAKILIEKFMESKDNITPIIGNYFLTEEEMCFASYYETIIIADMALPKNNIHRLKKESDVVIFDHHIQDPLEVKLHENPVSKGAKPEEYPSTSYVINKFLGDPIDLYVLLGAVGDREEQLKENQIFWPIVEKYTIENGLNFNELLRMAELLDSIYRVGDKEGVEQAPHLLLENEGAHYILNNKKWNTNLKNLEEKMKEIMAEHPNENDGVLLKTINTPYNLISKVTRKIAWDKKKDTLVQNVGYMEGYAQIYARSQSLDMSSLIQYFKEKGYSAGGKIGVIGLVVPIEYVDEATSKIIEHIKTIKND